MEDSGNVLNWEYTIKISLQEHMKKFEGLINKTKLIENEERFLNKKQGDARSIVYHKEAEFHLLENLLKERKKYITNLEVYNVSLKLEKKRIQIKLQKELDETWEVQSKQESLLAKLQKYRNTSETVRAPLMHQLKNSELIKEEMNRKLLQLEQHMKELQHYFNFQYYSQHGVPQNFKSMAVELAKHKVTSLNLEKLSQSFIIEISSLEEQIYHLLPKKNFCLSKYFNRNMIIEPMEVNKESSQRSEENSHSDISISCIDNGKLFPRPQESLESQENIQDFSYLDDNSCTTNCPAEEMDDFLRNKHQNSYITLQESPKSVEHHFQNIITTFDDDNSENFKHTHHNPARSSFEVENYQSGKFGNKTEKCQVEKYYDEINLELPNSTLTQGKSDVGTVDYLTNQADTMQNTPTSNYSFYLDSQNSMINNSPLNSQRRNSMAVESTDYQSNRSTLSYRMMKQPQEIQNLLRFSSVEQHPKNLQVEVTLPFQHIDQKMDQSIRNQQFKLNESELKIRSRAGQLERSSFGFEMTGSPLEIPQRNLSKTVSFNLGTNKDKPGNQSWFDDKASKMSNNNFPSLEDMNLGVKRCKMSSSINIGRGFQSPEIIQEKGSASFNLGFLNQSPDTQSDNSDSFALSKSGMAPQSPHSRVQTGNSTFNFALQDQSPEIQGGISSLKSLFEAPQDSPEQDTGFRFTF